MFETKIVELLRSDGAFVQAVLSEGFSQRVVDFIVRVWEPELRRINAPDAHWRWTSLWTDFRHGKSRFCSLECEDHVQGVMWLDYSGIRSKLTDLPLVYVQRLSVAPWNRSAAQVRRFRPIGSIFVREAVEYSRDLGWKGRIGLHALPTAIPWYKNVLRMTALGPDVEHEDLEYFEFSSDQSATFLENE